MKGMLELCVTLSLAQTGEAGAGVGGVPPVGHGVSGVLHGRRKVQHRIGTSAQVEGRRPVAGALVKVAHLPAAARCRVGECQCRCHLAEVVQRRPARALECTAAWGCGASALSGGQDFLG